LCHTQKAETLLYVDFQPQDKSSPPNKRRAVFAIIILSLGTANCRAEKTPARGPPPLAEFLTATLPVASRTNPPPANPSVNPTRRLRQSGMKMDAVGRRRYVEAIPRGLLVALVPAAAAAAMANGRRGVLVPVRGRRARRRVLLKHVGPAAAAVARLACACLWQW
jgi:hypothetical protein